MDLSDQNAAGIAGILLDFDILRKMKAMDAKPFADKINEVLLQYYHEIVDDWDRRVFSALLVVMENEYPQYSRIFDKFLLLI
jgi:hypothetical protein